MNETTTIQSISEENLKKTDFIVLVDVSGSMGTESTRFEGKNRLEEVAEDAAQVARMAGKYDADGLTLITFGSDVTTTDGVTAANVGDVFAKTKVGGSTNLTDAIKAAHAKAKSTDKEVVCFVYTDGAPNSQPTAKAALVEAGKELGDTKIGFIFIQVGDDSGAATFLKDIDENLEVDIVATVTAAEAEKLDVAQLAWLARNA